MYIITLNKDKHMLIRKGAPIYKGENNADMFQFLIQPEINEIELDKTLITWYIFDETCDNKIDEGVLNLSKGLNYLEANVPISNKVTKNIGKYNLCLKAVREGDVILKTNNVTFSVNNFPNTIGEITEEELTLIEQLMIEINTVKNTSKEQGQEIQESKLIIQDILNQLQSLQTELNRYSNNLGDLNTLKTKKKNNIVNAINELEDKKLNESNIIQYVDGMSETLIPSSKAISEFVTNLALSICEVLGDESTLKTTSKVLVDAINEVYDYADVYIPALDQQAENNRLDIKVIFDELIPNLESKINSLDNGKLDRVKFEDLLDRLYNLRSYTINDLTERIRGIQGDLEEIIGRKLDDTDITQEIEYNDTTHIPSADAVWQYIDKLLTEVYTDIRITAGTITEQTGDKKYLSTSDKSNLVNAINELNTQKVDGLKLADYYTKEQLDERLDRDYATYGYVNAKKVDKSDVVEVVKDVLEFPSEDKVPSEAAVSRRIDSILNNEVSNVVYEAFRQAAEEEIGNPSDLETDSKLVVNAINEINDKISNTENQILNKTSQRIIDIVDTYAEFETKYREITDSTKAVDGNFVIVLKDEGENNYITLRKLQRIQNIFESIVVKAIEPKALKSEIGNLSNLQTQNKETIVTALNEVLSLAKGISGAVVYEDYQTLIEDLNYAPSDVINYKIGQTIYIKKIDVPDLWISGKGGDHDHYQYSGDYDFIDEIKNNGSVWVHNYEVSMLETAKVNLSNYATKDELTNIDTKASEAQANAWELLNLVLPNDYYKKSEIDEKIASSEGVDIQTFQEFAIALEEGVFQLFDTYGVQIHQVDSIDQLPKVISSTSMQNLTEELSEILGEHRVYWGWKMTLTPESNRGCIQRIPRSIGNNGCSGVYLVSKSIGSNEYTEPINISFAPPTFLYEVEEVYVYTPAPDGDDMNSCIVWYDGGDGDSYRNDIWLVKKDNGSCDKYILNPSEDRYELIGGSEVDLTNYYNKTEVNSKLSDKVSMTDIKDNLTSTDSNKPLSAKQGKVLKDDIGNKSNLTTQDKTNLVNAINEVNTKTDIPFFDIDIGSGNEIVITDEQAMRTINSGAFYTPGDGANLLWTISYKLTDFGYNIFVAGNYLYRGSSISGGSVTFSKRDDGKWQGVINLEDYTGLTNEEWEFELEDGTTVTKKIAIWESLL